MFASHPASAKLYISTECLGEKKKKKKKKVPASICQMGVAAVVDQLQL